MSEGLKNILPSIISVGAAIIIPLAACLSNNSLLFARMDERVASIKEEMARHELQKEREITRLHGKSEDHEQRIARLEANLGAIQETLTEMRKDIKLLLQGIRQ